MLSTRQRRMTREEFDQFLREKRMPICLTPPYDVVPCACGDTNCHGWRFVATFDGPDEALPRVDAAPRRDLQLVPPEHTFTSLETAC